LGSPAAPLADHDSAERGRLEPHPEPCPDRRRGFQKPRYAGERLPPRDSEPRRRAPPVVPRPGGFSVPSSARPSPRRHNPDIPPGIPAGVLSPHRSPDYFMAPPGEIRLTHVVSPSGPRRDSVTLEPLKTGDAGSSALPPRAPAPTPRASGQGGDGDSQDSSGELLDRVASPLSLLPACMSRGGVHLMVANDGSPHPLKTQEILQNALDFEEGGSTSSKDPGPARRRQPADSVVSTPSSAPAARIRLPHLPPGRAAVLAERAAVLSAAAENNTIKEDAQSAQASPARPVRLPRLEPLHLRMQRQFEMKEKEKRVAAIDLRHAELAVFAMPAPISYIRKPKAKKAGRKISSGMRKKPGASRACSKPRDKNETQLEVAADNRSGAGARKSTQRQNEIVLPPSSSQTPPAVPPTEKRRPRGKVKVKKTVAAAKDEACVAVDFPGGHSAKSRREVLLTDGAGVLGRALIDEFVRREFRVTVLTSKPLECFHQDVQERFSHLGICHVQLDLAADVAGMLSKLTACVESGKFELIVNVLAERAGLAQASDITQSREENVSSNVFNIELSDCLAKLATRFSINMIQLSTDHVFTGQGNLPEGYPALKTEEQNPCFIQPGNSSPFALQKMEAEQRVKGSDKVTVVRIPNVYGPMLEMHEEEETSLSIANFLGENDWFYDTWQRRYLTSAADCAFILGALASKLLRSGLTYKVYHYGAQKSVSKYDYMVLFSIAAKMRQELIKPEDLEAQSVEKQLPYDLKLDIGATRAELAAEDDWREPEELDGSRICGLWLPFFHQQMKMSAARAPSFPNSDAEDDGDCAKEDEDFDIVGGGGEADLPKGDVGSPRSVLL